MGNPHISTNAACYNLRKFKQSDKIGNLRLFYIIYYFINLSIPTSVTVIGVIITRGKTSHLDIGISYQ